MDLEKPYLLTSECKIRNNGQVMTQKINIISDENTGIGEYHLLFCLGWYLCYYERDVIKKLFTHKDLPKRDGINHHTKYLGDYASSFRKFFCYISEVYNGNLVDQMDKELLVLPDNEQKKTRRKKAFEGVSPIKKDEDEEINVKEGRITWSYKRSLIIEFYRQHLGKPPYIIKKGNKIESLPYFSYIEEKFIDWKIM